jgi:hypothetical protein
MNPAGNLKARFIKRLVLLLEIFSYERKNCVKSLSGMARIQSHIIRPLGQWGHQRMHGYSQTLVVLLGEGDADKTLSIAMRDRDPSETQRSLGHAHTRNETEYTQSL